jgi:hypothetical protein
MRCRAFAFALLLAALPLRGDVRLLAPAHGDELAGGSRATVEWDGAIPPDVEEWEAFFSVDGGRYYGWRITPHLDSGIHRFTFTVPNLPTRDARILLRFGDERRETEVELPARFAVRAVLTVAPRALAVDRGGEPAREADRPVAGWVAGGRDGSGLRELVRRNTSLADAHLLRCALPRLEDSESPDDEALCFEDGTSLPHHVPRARAARPSLSLRRDPLLATMRLNL